MSKIKLYRHKLSGHSHRAELFLSLLNLDFEMIDIDFAKKEHKSPEFLKKNTFGQLPVIEDGTTLVADSNAILIYLAKTYDKSGSWLPNDAQTAAEIQRFLSVAAGRLAYGPARARLVTVFNFDTDAQPVIADSHNLLKILDDHLSQSSWLVRDNPTIADIANYTYIAHAPEGSVSLDAYKNVRAWLANIEGLAGFVPMYSSAVGLVNH